MTVMISIDRGILRKKKWIVHRNNAHSFMSKNGTINQYFNKTKEITRNRGMNNNMKKNLGIPPSTDKL